MNQIFIKLGQTELKSIENGLNWTKIRIIWNKIDLK